MSKYEELKELIAVCKRKLALISTFNLVHQLEHLDYVSLIGYHYEVVREGNKRLYSIALSEDTKAKLYISNEGHVDALTDVKISQGLFEFGIDMDGVTDIAQIHKIHEDMIQMFRKLIDVIDEHYKLPDTKELDRISVLESSVSKLTATINSILKGQELTLQMIGIMNGQIESLESGEIQTLKDLNTLELKP